MRRVPKLSFGQGQLMLWILAGTLLAFGVMFVFFRFSGVALTTTRRELPHISVMQPPSQNPFSPSDSRYVMADLFDPSLMSLPSAHGFSMGMWRHKIEAAHYHLGWDEQPAYLDAEVPGQPRLLLEATPVDTAVLATAEKAPAIFEDSNDNESGGPTVPVNQSVFRVLGALEDRVVVYAPPLPVLNSPKPLPPTQIRVGVCADGLVLYALLDHSCDDDTVDAQALTLAQQTRFEAEHDTSGTALTWGLLRFLWATQLPATTNAEAAATQN